MRGYREEFVKVLQTKLINWGLLEDRLVRTKGSRFILNSMYSQEMNSAGGSTEYSENHTIGFPKAWLRGLLMSLLQKCI